MSVESEVLSEDAESLLRRERRLKAALADNGLGLRRSHLSGTDLMPFAIPADEWRVLSEGLAQRARLFNVIAADAYGEQTLWKRGVLPPEILFANPDFMNVAWQTKPSLGIYVQLAASDLIRTTEGRWLVVGDRLQVAEGLGDVLENRLAVARAFPELFRLRNVERLAGFFKRLIDGLQAIHGSSDGRIVLLASGPDSARRNEDAILSRYLSLPLVENDDLAVRGLKVYMKTLGGLKPVGTIFRRVPDAMCDPLELRVDSGEGAVGLVSCVREGTVGLSNFLGTGVLETGLLKPYLPVVCRELLGEELLLPDVKTVSLADTATRDAVLDAPNGWYFRRAFGDRTLYRYDEMPPTAQLALLRKIEAEPRAWTAESRVELDKAPVWHERNWMEAKLKCRFFMLNGPDGTSVLPGGLCACSETAGAELLAARWQKDVWVLSETPPAAFTLLAPADEPVTSTRAGGDLPSRAAENLYRLGRALAAVDIQGRLARGLAVRLSDETWTDLPELPRLLKAAVSEVSDAEPTGDPENALRGYVLRKGESANIQAHLSEIRGLAVQVRDRVSDDLWQALSCFGEQDLTDDSSVAALIPALNRVLVDSSSVAGLCAESMTRGHEWRFQEIGRRLERATRTLRLLRCMLLPRSVDRTVETAVLAALLEVGDCSMTYRRRYGGRLQAAPVVDLLLCDESNPRSVAYQVVRLREESRHLPNHTPSEAVFSPLDRDLMRLLTDLRLADVATLLDTGLITMLNEAEELVGSIADRISRAYLNHAPRSGVIHALTTEV